MELENLEETKTPDAKIRIGFDVPASECRATYERTLKELSREVAVKGFRKGKAPLHLVESRVGMLARSRSLRRIQSRSVREILRRKNLDIEELAAPVEILDSSPFDPDETFHLNLLLAPEPKVELRKYRGLKLTKRSAEPSETQIESSLRSLAERNALYESVDREARETDQVIISGRGKHPSPELTKKLVLENYAVVLEESKAPAEIRNALLGRRKGERVNFSITFPETVPEEKLRNATIEYDAEILEVKERTLPAIDEEFARELRFDSLEELREKIRLELRKQLVDAAFSELEADLLEKLREENPLEDVPIWMIEKEKRRRMEKLKRRLDQSGVALEDILERSRKSREDFEAEQEEIARQVVHTSVVLRAIARQEKIHIDDRELARYLINVAAEKDTSVESLMRKLRDENALEPLREDLLKEKVLYFLLENAEVVEEADETGAAETAPRVQEAAGDA
ncbi:MAG: trigger factor [Candidatus Hydrogenedentota bacterium]|nr:MAG: trigger factor [Candidatus Hydrogenedentota bacterium]